MNEKKLLILSSVFFAAIWVLILIIKSPNTTFSIDTEDQFTYGNSEAPVHMIIFEEFSCPLCRMLYIESLPFIEEKYVETGKVKVTIIPTAFLADSMAACTLSVCIQKLAPSEMKAFYDFLFHLPETDLISFSFRDFVSSYLETNKALPAPRILKELREETFEAPLERNLALARQVYPGDIHVPIVLINGKLITKPDQKTISKAIDEAL
jgi:protein-disulfide isomerase